MNVEIPDFTGRILVGDTETTGMKIEDGNKLIEIAFVELENRVRTGRTLHIYVDPEREVEDGAYQVHGWDRESLINESGGKTFKHVAGEIEQFLEGAMVVFHNAPYDIGYLDKELAEAGCRKLTEIAKVYDSLKMARKLYPGKKNSLDALCKRLGVDASSRELHGALIDSDILVDVFLSLSGTQDNLATIFREASGKDEVKYESLDSLIAPVSKDLNLVVVKANETEITEHDQFIGNHLK